jgi:hypothetical protein
MNVRRGFFMGAVAIVASVAMIQPAAADVFDWDQNAGFFFPGADASTTLMGGSVNNTYGPPIAGNGGLEFGLVTTQPPSPTDTYGAIVWGCTADGDNDTPADAEGVCANAGVLANAVVGGDPTNPLAAGRSALKVTAFDSTQNGQLDSLTEAAVAIARVDHLNRVIDNESNSLAAVEIRANLLITNPLAGGANVLTSPNTVPITFIETNNLPAGLGSTDADCKAAGFLNPLGSVCDDEFTFDTSSFQNIPFSANGKDFFVHFGLGPVPECDTPDGNLGTIQFFSCDDDPVNHRIAIDFFNGKAWAKEGFDNAIQVTMFITEEPLGNEGCTPGFWKQSQHFDSWTAPFTPGQSLISAFPSLDELTATQENRTLLATLAQGGGGVTALLRHFVAAVLNAANPDVTSKYENIQAIVDAVETVLQGGTATLGGVQFSSVEALKNALEAANELGCPLS